MLLYHQTCTSVKPNLGGAGRRRPVFSASRSKSIRSITFSAGFCSLETAIRSPSVLKSGEQPENRALPTPTFLVKARAFLNRGAGEPEVPPWRDEVEPTRSLAVAATGGP